MTAQTMSTGVVSVHPSARSVRLARGTTTVRRVPSAGVSASTARIRPTRGESARGRAAATGAVRGSLRTTVRGRRVVLGLIVVVSAGLGLLGGQAVAATPAAPALPAETVRVVVEPGDTLWELALGLVEPGEDIRDVVLAIQEMNGMGSSALSVGDELVLPAA